LLSVFEEMSVSSVMGYSTVVTGRFVRIAMLHEGMEKREKNREAGRVDSHHSTTIIAM